MYGFRVLALCFYVFVIMVDGLLVLRFTLSGSGF